MEKKPLWKYLTPLLVGVVICLIPVPAGMQPNAWYYFALFVTAILALILEPIPPAAVGLISVTLATALFLVDPKPAGSLRWALSGFSNGVVWLIFVAYLFAKGYEKTGLGHRIALLLVKALGKSTLGLGYAVALSDLALAPFTPSNTARSGGTIYPIIKNIPPLYDSQPGDESARKIGAYLMWTAFAATCVTSSMFITSCAPNLFALELVAKFTQVKFTWTDWALGFLPIGLLLFILAPYLVYLIFPPTVKVSKDVPTWAANELKKMGNITRKEVTMACLVLCALTLWIFGGKWVDATTAALMVVSGMLLTGIVTWDDVIGNKQAWNILAWFATLVTLADGLNRVKFLDWLAVHTAALVQGMPVLVVLLLFVAMFFYIHYMFASLSAHTTALLPVFLATAVAIPNMEIKVLSLMLVYALGIMGILTPYATGPSPIYYGSGYIKSNDFWRLGLIFGTIYLVVLLGVGYPYLKWLLS
jgi:L-tartrate/succinate antiporter